MLTHRRTTRTFEARMLALADDVFNEFDDLPVLTVMRAISTSWAELRTVPATRPMPEAIVSRARAKLHETRLETRTAT